MESSAKVTYLPTYLPTYLKSVFFAFFIIMAKRIGGMSQLRSFRERDAPFGA